MKNKRFRIGGENLVIKVNTSTIELELEIDDPTTTKYLSQFEEPERSEKAMEALKIGVIAIQSATPSLDTAVVEEKFREVEGSINKCLEEFTIELKGELEGNFKPESGNLPRSIENAFGLQGTVSKVFNQYFDPETGRVSVLLERQLGPSSTFTKALDPNHKESVICQIEESVRTLLQQKTTEIVSQFSLDIPDSALSRLKKGVSEELKTIKEDNNKFFGELKTHLGIEIGRQSEAEKGTQKGRDFESILYDRVAEWGRNLDDHTENTTGSIGAIPRRKTGDYVVTLGKTSGSEGDKIVFEVKKSEYTLKNAHEELKEAKENREAQSGIMIFAKGYEPTEIGDFRQIGSDFFVTVEEELLLTDQPLIFAESAYKLARAVIVTAKKKREAKQIDFDSINSRIEDIRRFVERISELVKKSRKIQSDSTSIIDIANEIKSDMDDSLDEINDLLKQ